MQNTKVMENAKKIAVVVLALLAFSIASSDAIVLDFANLPGTVVDFSGGGFTFTSANNGQFDITSVQGGTGTSVGLDGGVVSGEPFMIGTISNTSTPFGTIESAPVTGTGVLYIMDGSSIDLTGFIQWDNITTLGTGGTLDLTGTINLTDIVYTGANSDLLALAGDGSATDTLSFQFTSGSSLEELATTGGLTSYSGSISAVPEPGTMTLVSAGLMGLFSLRILRKRQ